MKTSKRRLYFVLAHQFQYNDLFKHIQDASQTVNVRHGVIVCNISIFSVSLNSVEAEEKEAKTIKGFGAMEIQRKSPE